MRCQAENAGLVIKAAPLHVQLKHLACGVNVIPAAMSNRPSTSSTTHTQQIAPTVPAAVQALAVPTPLLIDSQLPAYLLPCILSLLRESTGQVVRRKRQKEDELREEGLLPPIRNGKGKGKASEEEMSEVIEREALEKIERMGLMVGGYIAEKCV